MTSRRRGDYSAGMLNLIDLDNIDMAKFPIGQVDGILLDLGVSSHQLDTPERGFSYHHDAPPGYAHGPG